MSPHRSAALRYVAEDGRTGYADAGDRLVRALLASGIDVEHLALAPEGPGGAPVIVPSRRTTGSGAIAPADVPTVAHLVPEHYPQVRAEVATGPLVGHTVWETDAIPGHWATLLNATDRVVVPTAWNRDVFLAGGVTTPIVIVPHVLDDLDGPSIDLGLDLPDDFVVFSTIGRWAQRKRPDLTVRAFLAAFTGRDPVAMVVKAEPFVDYSIAGDRSRPGRLTGGPGLEVAHLLRDHPDPPRIHLAVEAWPAERIRGLHHRADCFVSLTHGEGWGLGLFDALAHGGAVLTTGWGAPVEWLGPDADGLVAHDLVNVRHGAPESYSPDQHWAEPRLDHAVELLRSVAADPAAAKRRAEPARDHIRRTCAPVVVADRFRRDVLDVLDER